VEEDSKSVITESTLKIVDVNNLTKSDDNQDAYLPVAKGADNFLIESDSDNHPAGSELAQENILKVNSQLSEAAAFKVSNYIIFAILPVFKLTFDTETPTWIGLQHSAILSKQSISNVQTAIALYSKTKDK
jgi:hypothetical protein